MKPWYSLVLPGLGIAALTLLAALGALPAQAVVTFLVGVALPSPVLAFRSQPEGNLAK